MYEIAPRRRLRRLPGPSLSNRWHLRVATQFRGDAGARFARGRLRAPVEVAGEGRMVKAVGATGPINRPLTCEMPDAGLL